MKLHLLAGATGLMALCATLAYADGYDGGRIRNYDGTYTGNITVTTTAKDYNGVERTGGTGTTTLQGNISINLVYGTGVSNAGGSFAASNIVLETLSAADSIVINTRSSEYTGSGTYDVGINQDTVNGSLTVNANKAGSFQELNITAGGNGISAHAGTLYINAATVINSAKSGITLGSYADPANSVYDDGHIVMTGTLDITAGGSGINLSYKENTLDLSGVTNMKIASTHPNGNGIYTAGAVLLGSHMEITEARTSALHASGNGGSISGTGKYIFSGKVLTESTSATIDLTFTKGSNFTGYTVLGSTTNTIDFALNQGARWEVTTNSTMSTLNVAQGGVIVFDLFTAGTKLFSYINAPEVHLNAGSILTLNFDPSNVQVGDEYTLFTGLATAFDNDTNGILNALLRSADGLYQYEYDNPRAGVFRILGIYSIPEPATASLGLFGLAGLMLRRRRG